VGRFLRGRPFVHPATRESRTRTTAAISSGSDAATVLFAAGRPSYLPLGDRIAFTLFNREAIFWLIEP